MAARRLAVSLLRVLGELAVGLRLLGGARGRVGRVAVAAGWVGDIVAVVLGSGFIKIVLVGPLGDGELIHIVVVHITRHDWNFFRINLFWLALGLWAFEAFGRGQAATVLSFLVFYSFFIVFLCFTYLFFSWLWLCLSFYLF